MANILFSNVTILLVLKGEPGWICLMCCNVDSTSPIHNFHSPRYLYGLPNRHFVCQISFSCPQLTHALPQFSLVFWSFIGQLPKITLPLYFPLVISYLHSLILCTTLNHIPRYEPIISPLSPPIASFLALLSPKTECFGTPHLSRVQIRARLIMPMSLNMDIGMEM